MLLTGPVGSGKSTAALSLADHLRAAGRSTAVIDLDLVYCMARQRGGFAEADVWRTARRGAAALVDAFFASGLEVVVVEGGFFENTECNALRDYLVTRADAKFVTLNVSYEEALQRAQSDPDPTRVVSRNPDVLQRLHTEFVRALPWLRSSSSVIEADRMTPQEIARSIAEKVLGEVKGPRGSSTKA